MRKLASIQTITNIEPIPNADNIVLASVLGWKVVIRKDEFTINDKIIYCEIDSYLPIVPEFEFLRKSCYRNNEVLGEGFRIKTMKLRGVLSQGLILPLSILPNNNVYSIGDDVTDILNIRKWEIPDKINLRTEIKGEFPDFIPKTDEPRIQVNPNLIHLLKQGGEYYITSKMDGTSMTVYLHNDIFGVCGHNYEFKKSEDCTFWKYAIQHDLENKMRNLELHDIAIQGEFCGFRVQDNPLKLTGYKWYIFTIYDIKNNRRYSLNEMKTLVNNLNLDIVPIEEINYTFPYTSIDDLLNRAKGNYNSGNKKEGIVIRNTIPYICEETHFEPVSFKVINNEYLLKKDK